MWEKYERKYITNNNFISIRKDGFGFGNLFIKLHKLDDYRYVDVYVDGDKIGFKFIKDRIKNSYRVTIQNGVYRSIVCKNLLKEKMISNTRKKYEDYYIERDKKFGKLFVINFVNLTKRS